MRLKLDVDAGTSERIGITVTTSALSTVADVAEALLEAGLAGPRPEAGRATLFIVSQGAFLRDRRLDPDDIVTECALRSGCTVQVVPHRESRRSDAVAEAAVLRILDGPDAGREFSLGFGSSTVGRDPSMTVRLSDPLVSKRHARITVGDAVEIVDTNSANGVVLAGIAVQRTTLEPSDVIVLGDTTLCVVPVRRAGDTGAEPSVDFVRSPRVVARFPPRTYKSPTPPKRPNIQPFPIVMLVAPIVLGVALYLITGSLTSILFTALTPLLAIGVWADQKIRAALALRAQRRQFSAGLAQLEELVTAAQRVERAVREAETPAVDDAIAAVRQLGPALWTHRPEHPEFLTVRLGRGRLPSRCAIELPDPSDALPEYWRQAADLAERMAWVDNVPVVVDLRSAGSVGVAGPADPRTATARALVLQVIAFHSPAEVAVAAIVSSQSRSEWDWLRWVPHTTSPQSPVAAPHLAADPGAVEALVESLESLIALRTADPHSARGPIDPQQPEPSPAPVVPGVVLIVENDAQFDRARLIALAERGPDVGLHLVWCASSVNRLPAAARSFVLTADGPSTAGQVRLGQHVHPLETERVDARTVDDLARTLAPVTDASAMVEDQADLPGSVSYVALAGAELLDDAEFVEERWRENHSVAVRGDGAPRVKRAPGGLRALVGATGTDALSLDLRRDGPHALVGGTTGAGKSEFLQAWVLGLASAYSPDRITFLFVDYKGGAAFADCLPLPHTVGLVTDLSPHLVRRALTSLRAELRYREELLHRKRAKDLVSLEASGDPDVPPNLVIVVDEFAALVQEVPEFVDGVVDVAQRGRSLGLHLILATQRPAGVIKENLRANTNLRVALRMADAEDSRDVIGDALAHHFSAEVPGRAAAKMGSAAPMIFQAAYAGGHTPESVPAPPVVLEGVGFDSARTWEVEAVSELESTSGPNDVTRIVRTVALAARRSAIPTPRRPWLDELAPSYDFARLPQPRTDEELLLGVIDRPAEQAQPTYFYRPDRDGNVAIFGTGGTGKSAALRSIAVAAAVTPRGGPAQVYAVDHGARGLAMLEVLPHVGAVVDGDDTERVGRLLRRLRDTVDERAERYAAVRAGSIVEYRRIAERPDEPRILLLIDNFAQFREQYEFVSNGQLSSALTQIATDGRQVGIHLVVTADRPASIPPSLNSTIQRRIILRLPTEDDYLFVGAPKDVLDLTSPPGRGIIDGDEVQLAVLGGDANVAVQARHLAQLAQSMRRQGVAEAPGVQRLPLEVSLQDLPQVRRGAAVIGLADEDLEPIGMPTNGVFVIAGASGSGRTTAMETIVGAYRRAVSGAEVVLMQPRPSALSLRLAPEEDVVGAAQITEVATRWADRLEGGPVDRTIFVLPAIADLASSEAEFALERLVRIVGRSDALLVAEGETSTWSQYSAFSPLLKAAKSGLLLAPSELDGDLVFGTPIGRVRRADFPAGRGFLIGRGRAIRLQIAMP